MPNMHTEKIHHVTTVIPFMVHLQHLQRYNHLARVIHSENVYKRDLFWDKTAYREYISYSSRCKEPDVKNL